MDFLGKLKFQVWDSVGTVVTLFQKWEPKDCKSEKDFEKSLYTFLHEELGDIQITKQYAQGRVRADLMIADKVIVELKYNLDTTAKYQRLVGQVADYKEWKGKVVILLTGETDLNLRKQLDAYLKKEDLSGDPLGVNKVTVFQK